MKERINTWIHYRPQEPHREETAAVGELAADFFWHLLSMLAEADVRGGIADDTANELAQVELRRLSADEAKCLYEPYSFEDGFTKCAYLAGRNVQPDQTLNVTIHGEK